MTRAGTAFSLIAALAIAHAATAGSPSDNVAGAAMLPGTPPAASAPVELPPVRVVATRESHDRAVFAAIAVMASLRGVQGAGMR